MYIVENGISDYFIVNENNPDKALITAANELQTYIEKISGAELEIISESGLENGSNAIILRSSADGISADGFSLTSDGNQLIINGSDSRGTLYGVYTFLEEYLGVRWFTPELEVVPESNDIVIDSAISRIVEPSFSIRRNDTAGTNDAYRARTKMNVSFWNEMPDYGGALTYVLWDVTLDKLVPDVLFSEHPEYFAMNPVSISTG